MPGFGRTNPWPFAFGGGKRHVEVCHEQLAEQVKGVLDIADEHVDAELYAEACLLAEAWNASERVGNQLQPMKMLENLPVWEEASGLRPNSKDNASTRRAALAGKFAAYTRNDIASIEEAARRTAGKNFVSLSFVADDNEIVYWPGVYPGPPGLEWSSNRDIYIVTVNKNGLTQEQFTAMATRLLTELDKLVPAYGRVSVTLGSGFVPSVSLVGEVGP